MKILFSSTQNFLVEKEKKRKEREREEALPWSSENKIKGVRLMSDNKEEKIKGLKFWQVDAFTKTPFKGNPAAVFVLKEALPKDTMQSIAVEMNLSETAFVLLRKGQNPLLRWFTPCIEIDLCGHATLASAHVYLTTVDTECSNVVFDTLFAGPLSVARDGSAGYTMNFPSRPGKLVEIESIPDFVLTSLCDEKPVYARKARDLMLVYESVDAVRNMNPDFNALKKYASFIIVTAKAMETEEYDFISRFFCADDGIAEDPVTGSAHCTLAPYWAKHYEKKNYLLTRPPLEVASLN